MSGHWAEGKGEGAEPPRLSTLTGMEIANKGIFITSNGVCEVVVEGRKCVVGVVESFFVD